MSSRCPDGRRPAGLARVAAAAVAIALTVAAEIARAAAAAPAAPPLRVCSDPNNLPFSNAARAGFENRIAALIARELGTTVQYTWWAQRRGFFRNTLNAGRCDVVMGVPTGIEMALATRPYYRSTYVWVSRRDRGLSIRSFDDPRLPGLKIGVQLAGDDYANTPPAHALMERGIVSNVSGFTLYGDYAKPNPPARIVEAVADGSVDIAVVWGPLAGWVARARRDVPLRLVPVDPPRSLAALPFVYDIAVGVRRGDRELRSRLDRALDRRATDISRILDAYGIPRLPKDAGSAPRVALRSGEARR